MIKSLNTKLIVSFLSFSIISVFIIIFNQIYNRNKQEVEDLLSILNQSRIIHLNDQKIFRDYLYIDTHKSNYFETNNSTYLTKHDSLFSITKNIIKVLSKNDISTSLEIVDHLKGLNSNLDSFDNYTKSIIKYTVLKGFKDYGNIGVMREHAHNLEVIREFPTEFILMMRRHEKDFIIRSEEKYADKFHTKYKKYKSFITNSSRINKAKKDAIIYEMDKYRIYFDSLLMYTKIIGAIDNTGLYKKMNNISEKLRHDFVKIENKAENAKRKLFKRFWLYYTLILIFTITISIIAGIILARIITTPIYLLSGRMNLFVQSNFTNKSTFHYDTKTTEIKDLVSNYSILKEKLLDLIDNMQEKVNKRTEEINAQNEYILSQNNNLIKQKQELERINKNIYDGLTYAGYLQNSLLPDISYVNEIFPNSFIYHKAKDVVSGDFYWINGIRNNQQDLSILVVADSTGHGVAGALMSMIGIISLNEIINREDVNSAGKIIAALRDNINENLQSNNNKAKSNNGMDIGIFVLNNNNMHLQFSGAQNNLWILRNGEIIELKGDKIAIGGCYTDTKHKYSDNEIQVKKGDIIYMFTDGYIDQLGGDNEDRFKKKHLKVLLKKIYSLPMQKQKDVLDEVNKNWRRTLEQTDDILIVGIKV